MGIRRNRYLDGVSRGTETIIFLQPLKKEKRKRMRKLFSKGNRKLVGISTQRLERGLLISTVSVKLLFLLSIVLFIYAGARLMLENPLFALKRVELKGLVRADRNEIMDFIPKIPSNASIFTLDLESILLKVSNHSYVRNASIWRRLDGTLRIEIEEREPFMLLLIDGNFYYMDEMGKRFKKVSDGEELDFIIVSGLSEEEFTTNGEKVEDTLKRVAKFVHFLKGRRYFDPSLISEINIHPVNGVILFPISVNVEVRLGMEGLEDKIKRIERLISEGDIELRGVRYIDFTLEDRVFVLKEGEKRGGIVKIADSKGRKGGLYSNE